jgi:hypothetical protein
LGITTFLPVGSASAEAHNTKVSANAAPLNTRTHRLANLHRVFIAQLCTDFDFRQRK